MQETNAQRKHAVRPIHVIAALVAPLLIVVALLILENSLHGQLNRELFLSTYIPLEVLRICIARIISKHGGRIWAESEIGKGTTMFFTLSG